VGTIVAKNNVYDLENKTSFTGSGDVMLNDHSNYSLPRDEKEILD
jgi:hypothetical protein